MRQYHTFTVSIKLVPKFKGCRERGWVENDHCAYDAIDSDAWDWFCPEGYEHVGYEMDKLQAVTVARCDGYGEMQPCLKVKAVYEPIAA